MCLLHISDYCDYDSSTSSSDDLPDVQIQIGLGAERSLLHNKGHKIPPHLVVMMEIMFQFMMLL